MLFALVALAALCCAVTARPATATGSAEAPRGPSAPSPHFDLFEALEDLWQPFRPAASSPSCLGGKLADSLWHQAAPLRADILESDAAYTVRVDVPGRSKNDIQVEIERNVLRLSMEEACGGQSQAAGDKEAEGSANTAVEGRGGNAASKYLRREPPCAASSRVIKLRDMIDQEGVRATVENGLLTVLLPKDEAQRPKKIRIA